MPLESATYVDDLVSTNPLGTDDASLGDDHIRLIKSVLKNTFPNLDGALTTKLAVLNGVSQLITVGSDGEALKFNWPSGGTVGNVTDWRTNQPVPASQADGRYIRSPANPGTDYRIQTLSRNKFSGGIFAFAEDGSNTQLQPAGDYATNPALNTEITNRTNADTNLQSQINNRVLKTGDTSTGWQIVKNKYDSGTVHWAPAWSSVIAGMSGGSSGGEYSCSFWMQMQDGAYTGAILSVNGFQGRKDTRFNEDGNIITPLGTVALTSQLPFTDQNLRWFVVRELVTKDGSGHSTHTFPVAFAARTQPFVLPVGSREDNTTYASLPMISLDSNGNPLISNTGMTLYWSTGSGNSISRAWLTYLVGGYF